MKNNRKSVVKVVLQMAADDAPNVEIPTQSDFQRWADVVVADSGKSEVCVRIVGVEESQRLNQRYRGRAAATNVLSFPCEASLLPEREAKPIGDIVIAAAVVFSEAREQGKQIMGHWAHLFIHGMLHLQGYDHADEEDACRMEACEIDFLNQLGFADPYRLSQ